MNLNYISITDCPYLETKIKQVLYMNNKTYINFYSSNLRPHYGGQLYDKGKFFNGKWYDIVEVTLINDDIFCVINFKEEIFKKNEIILLELDIERRSLISRMHSAIHLISYLNKDVMITGYAGVKKSRIDFIGNLEIFKSNLDDINKIFNKVIKENNKINIKYLNQDQMKNVVEYTPTNTNLNRVVEIEGYGSSMCSGSHVTSTNKIGSIEFQKPVILSDKSYKINIIMT